ncbi:hypothetical protein KDA_42110 [Dictyobacter alpinus]|uniref:N-acetyltransferase domain-containing protein n=1 Tax=Dictyobacter alpinus TaxID=2014873 RepID=A0A402BBS7_9CHLR|nr:GNAT family N-acetyltransferase [Dictyobacter alpinus]GCE28727.1 hypothetical protein KDA_42110 [Dictyobacter alpinus]
MALATWWQGDPLPELAPLPEFSARMATDRAALANLCHSTEEKIAQRIQTGSQPYIAYMGNIAAAYGWVAAHFGEVTEIGLRFQVPVRQRYLWDFETLLPWRGHGIYPRLLQAIIHQQPPEIERFWILYQPGNRSSEIGIHKAGFQSILDFSIEERGFLGYALNNAPRAREGAEFLQIPLVSRTEETC